jgi:hypothetical protein
MLLQKFDLFLLVFFLGEEESSRVFSNALEEEKVSFLGILNI